MARFNKAKNFAGKSYVVSNEVDSLIKSLRIESENEYKLVFDGIKTDDGIIGSQTIDLTTWFEKVTADINGQALGIEQGKGISFAQSSSSTNGGVKDITVIHADVDGTTIGFTEDSAAGKIKSLLTIKKLDAATTGYAASYQLQDADGNAIGETIDIVKDQFLKSTSLVWGTAAELSDGKPVGETTTKPETGAYPFLKMEFYSNDNGASSDDTSTTIVYIPVNELFRDYTAGNTAISIDNDNKISAVVDASDKVFASKGTESSVLSVDTNGIKASGIQAAIDLAVDDLKVKSQAALDDMSSDIELFEASVDSALSDMASQVNGAIDTVESNVGTAITSVNTALTDTVNSVNTKIGADVEAINGAVSTAITGVDNKVDAAVTAVNTNVGAAVEAVNGEIEGAVGAVNTALDATVDDINAKVGAAIVTVKTDVEGVVDAVNTALEATVGAVNTKVSDAIVTVKTDVAGVIGAVNTQVGAAIGTVKTDVAGVVGAVNTALEATVGAVNTKVSDAFANVFQMVEETQVEMAQEVTTDDQGAEVVLPVVKEITGRVLAVYDAAGYQIYPEIKYVGGKTMITADFGVRKEEQEGEEVIVPYSETWTVLKTVAVTFNNATPGTAAYTATASYTDAAYEAKAAYANATAADADYTAAASYTDAAATDVTFDADAAYENIAAIADVAYAAPAEATDATAGSASFSGAADDVTAKDVEADVAATIADLDYKVAAQA